MGRQAVLQHADQRSCPARLGARALLLVSKQVRRPKYSRRSTGKVYEMPLLECCVQSWYAGGCTTSGAGRFHLPNERVAKVSSPFLARHVSDSARSFAPLLPACQLQFYMTVSDTMYACSNTMSMPGDCIAAATPKLFWA
jgi:hypothetical protein